MPQILSIFSEHDRFIRRYMPMSREMYAMAFRLLQQPEEAEDVVQDVMLALYERRHSLPPEASELPYVLAMIRNRCIDRLRTPRPETLAPPGEEEGSGSEPLTPSPEAQLEARDYLEHILGGLPPRAAEVIRLRLVDGLSFEDIARQMGITAGNARVILSRTLQEIKRTPPKTDTR